MYVPTENGSVYAFSTEGQLRWQARPGDGRRYRAGPAIGTDGTIYVGGDEGRLFALDPANGSTKWSFGTGGAINASPAVGANGLVYLASGDGKVYVLSQSGRELGQFQTDGSIDGSSPAIGADGTLYVGTRNGTLYALRGDFTVPTDPGAAPAPAPTPSAPVATVPAPPGFAFVRCPSGRVYVLNADGRSGHLRDQPGPDRRSSPSSRPARTSPPPSWRRSAAPADNPKGTRRARPEWRRGSPRSTAVRGDRGGDAPPEEHALSRAYPLGPPPGGRKARATTAEKLGPGGCPAGRRRGCLSARRGRRPGGGAGA